jgi:3-dehydroquinate synthetase
MLPMSSTSVRERIKALLDKYQIPKLSNVNASELIEYIKVDKKAKGNKIAIVYVEKIGSFEIKEIEIDKMYEYINEVFNI